MYSINQTGLQSKLVSCSTVKQLNKKVTLGYQRKTTKNCHITKNKTTNDFINLFGNH